jgi:sodium/potassium-transporting ATPase subunit alpha
MTEGIVVQKEEKKETKIDITEHLYSFQELEEKLGVKFNAQKPSASAGLSEQERKERLEKYGPNCLSPPKKVHPILQFLSYFLQLFNVMLWVSGIVAYIIYGLDPVNNFPNVYIGGILLGVCVLNAGIEFFQTQKSQAILESFLNLIPANCYTVRDGQTVSGSAAELVMGDIVYIRSGDKIPADMVLIGANDLKVDNSSLTGEAEALERGTSNSQHNPLEATNLVFNGTLAVNGEGYGIVIRTGDNTVIGQIAFLTSSEDRRHSPMSMEIENFVLIIASVAAVITLIFFCVSKFVKNFTWAVSFNFAIGTFTGFVPQGLPATVTVLLSLAAKRMATRNVLVKDLQGVETLGAITLLATDKTGTLTRNQMTVTYIWAGARLYYAILQSGVDASAVPLDTAAAAPNEILHISALCSRARFETNEGPIHTRPILGDATEVGLLRNAALKLDEFEKLHDKYPKVFEIPFNSDNKWAMTIHKKKHATGSLMLYLKGAPERVLRICSTFHDGTKPVPLTEEHKKEFDRTYNFMASKGHRVLAFAALALPEDQFPENFEFKKDPINYPKVLFF